MLDACTFRSTYPTNLWKQHTVQRSRCPVHGHPVPQCSVNQMNQEVQFSTVPVAKAQKQIRRATLVVLEMCSSTFSVAFQVSSVACPVFQAPPLRLPISTNVATSGKCASKRMRYDRLSRCCLFDSPQQQPPVPKSSNLFVVVTAVFSMLTVLAATGVLWSEFAVIRTGCGPTNLSDDTERAFYVVVLVVASLSVFSRIVAGRSLEQLARLSWEDKEGLFFPIRVAEGITTVAVLGVFAALGSQIVHGERMDGMSGINVDMCKAIQETTVQLPVSKL